MAFDVAGVAANETVPPHWPRLCPSDAGFGKMISDAMPHLESNAQQVAVPSATLKTIVAAVSFLGDGLRDAFAGDGPR